MIIVLTGFACNGKTTTLSRLENKKFFLIKEPVRYFLDISDNLDLKTRQLAFLAISLAQWDLAKSVCKIKPVVMDRCFVDVIAFSRIHGLEISVPKTVFDFSNTVFFYILPPSEDLLEKCFQDKARQRTLTKEEYYEKELEFRKEYERIIGKRIKFFPHPVESNALLESLSSL